MRLTPSRLYADTSRVMYGIHSTSRQSQQRNVVVLALAICLWLLSYASHLHERGADHGAANEAATACVLCLSLPTGATPPATIAVLAPMALGLGLLLVTTCAAGFARLPSSYLSRGPPRFQTA